MAEGLSEEAARAQALAEFGDIHDVRRTLVAVDAGIERRKRRTEWMVSVWSDVRYAARTLRRAPRFTLAALTTLGLGVGLASMVIGAADAVLLRPLSYHEPERLVSLREITRDESVDDSVAFASLLDLERQGKAFAGLAGSALRPRNLTGRGQPQRVWSIVSPDFFDVLGVRPSLGRTFRRDENTTGRNRIAVISYGLWEQFGSAPDLLGSIVRIDDVLSRDCRRRAARLPASRRIRPARTGVALHADRDRRRELCSRRSRRPRAQRHRAPARQASPSLRDRPTSIGSGRGWRRRIQSRTNTSPPASIHWARISCTRCASQCWSSSARWHSCGWSRPSTWRR